MKTLITLILFATVTAHAEVTQADVQKLELAVQEAAKKRSTIVDLEAVFWHDKQTRRLMDALDAVKKGRSVEPY